MKSDNRTPAEIAQDLDRQAEEVLRATEGPSGLTDGIGRQNPFKTAEQALEPAPPAKEWGGRRVDFAGMTENTNPEFLMGL